MTRSSQSRALPRPAAIRILPKEAAFHYDLAQSLERSGDREGEITELREAIRIQNVPRDEVKPPIAGDSEAPVRSDPKNQSAQAVGLNQLATEDDALERDTDSSFLQGLIAGSGKWLPQDIDRGHLALGTALAELGDTREAIAAFDEAIQLGEVSNLRAKSFLFASLGNARRLTGDLPGAVAAYREAIRLGVLDSDLAIESRYGLGITLAESGDVQAAIAAFREATQHEHFLLVGQFRMLRAILVSQRPEDAIAVLRRVRERSAAEKAITDAIDRGMAQYKQLSKLRDTIPTNFRFSFQESSLPQHYYMRRYFVASAAIWSAGFVADPKLADDMQAENRYKAACSAALAAAGTGIERPAVPENVKTRWRRQAFDWLKADLTYWASRAESNQLEATARANKTLQRWKVDRDLASFRDEKELAKLPEHERKEWQTFSSEVAAFHQSGEVIGWG